MAIPDSDPNARDLDAAFEAAMNGPAKPRATAKTPAEVDHDAPHGRGEDGQPLAPFGLTKDGKPKRSAGGRPAKDSPDRARTGTVTELHPPAGDTKPAKAKPDPRDWTEELDGLGTAVWFGLSAVSKVSSSIPVVGKLLPGPKLAAEAFVLSEVQPQLVAAVNLAAQHNAKAAAFCARLEGGDGLWALQVMFMTMPVLSLAATVWKGDETALKEAELPGVAEMATRNGDKLDQMLTKIQAQIAAQVKAAQPGPQPAAEQ